MMVRVGMLCLVLASSAAARSGSSADEATLPSWSDQERSQWKSDGRVPGDLLLTDEGYGELNPSGTIEPLDLPLPNTGESDEPLALEKLVPESFWEAYFAARPGAFLVDPQNLLSPNDERERLEFLNYHAGDSAIDLYVYVFGGDQDIPREVRDEELVERFFSDARPAAVLFYYWGAPQRSTLALSPSLADVVSVAEQRRALESSAMQAFRDVEPARQFEAFLVQMSIRIYLMERMMHGDREAEVASLHKDASPIKKAGDSGLASHLEPLKEMAMPHAKTAGILSGVILVGGLMIAFRRMRRRYVFPEFDVEPRLGASHAAGVGAVISFASAAVPPAAQRDAMPDYLRRA